MLATLKDGFTYVRVWNLYRISNAAKIVLSYFYSRITGQNIHKGLPVSISIEPTTSCNLRCPQCPSGLRAFTRNTGMMQEDLNKKIIDELAPTLTYITYYFQGEPYLNKSFLEMIRYASAKNIYTSTSTNAHYLTSEVAKETVASGLSRLIISIDGTDQMTYEKYRIGGSLQKVIEGTKNLVEAKQNLGTGPLIIWQFIAFGHNEHQIPEIKKIAREIGVDKLVIKTAQIYDFESNLDLIPKQSSLSRYKKSGEGAEIKNKLLNHCWRLWQGCVITWDGKIAPCCFDKDASHQFGDMSKHTFKSIWTNTRYASFRKLVLKSRKNIDICQNCTEGTKIWA